MDANFNNYVRDLEARINDDERELLDRARAAAVNAFDTVLFRIQRRERVDAFVAAAVIKYGYDAVTHHGWDNAPFAHDGPCIEIRPANTNGTRFTTLPLKGEVWARLADGSDKTDNPLCFADDDEIFEYIDSFKEAA